MYLFFFSSRRRHTRCLSDWSSDVCSSDLPDDINGLIQAAGILTAHGGMTSHAAVVARGMGKPCVAGCEGLTIDLEQRTLTIGGKHLAEGDTITIDGGTGRVVLGQVPLVPP